MLPIAMASANADSISITASEFGFPDQTFNGTDALVTGPLLIGDYVISFGVTAVSSRPGLLNSHVTQVSGASGSSALLIDVISQGTDLSGLQTIQTGFALAATTPGWTMQEDIYVNGSILHSFVGSGNGGSKSFVDLVDLGNFGLFTIEERYSFLTGGTAGVSNGFGSRSAMLAVCPVPSSARVFRACSECSASAGGSSGGARTRSRNHQQLPRRRSRGGVPPKSTGDRNEKASTRNRRRNVHHVVCGIRCRHEPWIRRFPKPGRPRKRDCP